jgi:hypothetical protein
MANLSNINNKLILTDGGNVLIGQTNDAGFKLSVAGTVAIGADRSTYIDASEDSSATSHIFTTNAAVGDFSQLAGNLVIQARVHPSVYRDIIFAGGLNTAGPLMIITGEGKVGIGTTLPTTTLSVQGTSSNGINVIGVGTTATRCYLGLNASNHGYLSVSGSSGQSPSLINSAGGDSYISGGNFGIGTNSPGAKFGCR